MYFTKANRTAFIEIDNINDLEYEVEDPTLVKYEVIPKEISESKTNTIVLKVFRNVSSTFDESKFTIKNKFTNQKEIVELNFDVDKSVNTDEYVFYFFTKAQLLDIFTFVILIGLTYFIAKYFLINNVTFINYLYIG